MEERAEVVDWESNIEKPINPLEEIPPPSETEKETIDYNEALTLLEKFGESKKYSCWIPSVGAEVSFKEINAKQQKELLKSIVDSPLFKSKFTIAIFEILKENYIPTDVNFNKFTILDKQVIMLKTRIECFDKSYELTTENGNQHKIDLVKLYNKATKKLDIHTSDTITRDEVAVEVLLPTIETEYRLEKDMHSNLDFMDINNANTLRVALGDMFISEISKYISKISIGTKTILIISSTIAYLVIILMPPPPALFNPVLLKL